MPRRPNYRLERNERTRKQAERALRKATARAEKAKARQGDGETPEAGAEGAPSETPEPTSA